MVVCWCSFWQLLATSNSWLWCRVDVGAMWGRSLWRLIANPDPLQSIILSGSCVVPALFTPERSVKEDGIEDCHCRSVPRGCGRRDRDMHCGTTCHPSIPKNNLSTLLSYLPALRCRNGYALTIHSIVRCICFASHAPVSKLWLVPCQC